MPLRLCHQREDLLDEVGIELLEEVDPVVGGHLLEERPEMLAVGHLDEIDLPGERVVGEDVGLMGDREGIEELPQLPILEPLGKLRHAGRVELLGHATQAFDIPFGEHDPQFRDQEGVGGNHGGRPRKGSRL